MPWIAFLANGLWVMVIGLMGPSLPAIIQDYGITYGQAGLIFTSLSAGSLLGTFFGGLLSDYSWRNLLFSLFALFLALGLFLIGLSRGYTLLLLLIFVTSLLGSPIGAVGQTMTLALYPERRKQYLSLQTMFAAGGSFLAPLIITAAFVLGFSWRGGFFIASFLVFLHFGSTIVVKIPRADPESRRRSSFFHILKDGFIGIIALMVLLSMGIDLGFSYWLAEYFVTHAGMAVKYSGIAVSIFLAGIILGRFSTSWIARRVKSTRIILSGLVLAAAALLLFLKGESPVLKLILCFFYGLGVAPVFPMLLSLGTSRHPGIPGAVTGVLFAAMSLGGMIFPFLMGVLGHRFGIEGAYWSIIVLSGVIFIGVLVAGKGLHEGSD